MQALRITDQKEFMSALLAGSRFDSFEVSEASVTTFTTFHIDGSYHTGYFEEAKTEKDPSGKDPSDSPRSVSWKLIRPVVLSLVRGKRSPLAMKLVLRLSDRNVERLLAQAGISLAPSDVNGLFLNIRFASGELTVTTGSSLRIFTPDRILDHAWDEMIRRFLKQLGVGWEE